jgi:hypothetical protein
MRGHNDERRQIILGGRCSGQFYIPSGFSAHICCFVGDAMTELTLLWPYLIALGLCVALFVVPEPKPQRKRQTGDYLIYWPEEENS